MTTADGQDIKLIVHSRLMPARCGHRVIGLLLGEPLVLLYAPLVVTARLLWRCRTRGQSMAPWRSRSAGPADSRCCVG